MKPAIPGLYCDYAAIVGRETCFDWFLAISHFLHRYIQLLLLMVGANLSIIVFIIVRSNKICLRRLR